MISFIDMRYVTHYAKDVARLDAAGAAADMDLPGFRLHPLKGEFKGLWAVTVRANWRVIFRFAGGDALDVDYADSTKKETKLCR